MITERSTNTSRREVGRGGDTYQVTVASQAPLSIHCKNEKTMKRKMRIEEEGKGELRKVGEECRQGETHAGCEDDLIL